MSYSVDQIEDAIVATLEADATLSAYIKKFMILPTLDDMELQGLAWQGPAVGVIGVAGEYVNDMTGVMDDQGEFAVVALCRNLRSKTAAKGNLASSKGGWDIIHDCRTALDHSDLGLDPQPIDCVPRRRSLLFATGKAAGCMLELYVPWRYPRT